MQTTVRFKKPSRGGGWEIKEESGGCAPFARLTATKSVTHQSMGGQRPAAPSAFDTNIPPHRYASVRYGHLSLSAFICHSVQARKPSSGCMQVYDESRPDIHDPLLSSLNRILNPRPHGHPDYSYRTICGKRVPLMPVERVRIKMAIQSFTSLHQYSMLHALSVF